MNADVREERGSLIVGLSGDVDLEHSPAARKVLLESVGRKRNVIVDMAGVTYIDSSGVACLVEAYRNARVQGTGFALASASPAALRVLELARLDKVFTIHATLAEGLHDGT
jgi:anti-sigma B factor antagonist